MKPIYEPVFSRPPISDVFGRIDSTCKISAELSQGLHEQAMRLANFRKLSDAAFIRQLIEREVMTANLPKPDACLRIENGLTQIVHQVGRRK